MAETTEERPEPMALAGWWIDHRCLFDAEFAGMCLFDQIEVYGNFGWRWQTEMEFA